MTDDAARAVGFVVVGRDLTEQRKFELQILESQKLAALGVMARGIAHEIRTPLAISSSAAQFLTEDDLTPEFRRECAEKVHSGIRKASMGMSCGCPITHCGVATDVDKPQGCSHLVRDRSAGAPAEGFQGFGLLYCRRIRGFGQG